MATKKQRELASISQALHDILLQFSNACLTERPDNIINFAVEFFTKLQLSNPAGPQLEDEEDEDEISPSPSIEESETAALQFSSRRKSVFAEAYDPEKDKDNNEEHSIVFPKLEEQRTMLFESVKKSLLFRSLDSDEMSNVLDAMFERHVAADEIIMTQGEDANFFYVVQNGTYNVYIGDKLVHTYVDTGSFGELALLYNMPRAATIKAATDGFLWQMDRQTFRRIVVKSAHKKRKMYEKLLNSVPLLKSLKKIERMNLADALTSKYYKMNDVIIRQGDIADGMYFVEEGFVTVRIEEDKGVETDVVEYGPGAYFGELALVTHRPRESFVYATSKNVKVAFLEINTFNRLLGSFIDVIKRNFETYEELMQYLLLKNSHC